MCFPCVFRCVQCPTPWNPTYNLTQLLALQTKLCCCHKYCQLETSIAKLGKRCSFLKLWHQVFTGVDFVVFFFFFLLQRLRKPGFRLCSAKQDCGPRPFLPRARQSDHCKNMMRCNVQLTTGIMPHEVLIAQPISLQKVFPFVCIPI